MHTGGGDFEITIFTHLDFRDLDRGQGHMAYRPVLVIDLYIHTRLR